MNWRRLGVGLWVVLTGVAGCGSDDGGGGGGGGGGVAKTSCYDVCEAQQAAESAGGCEGIGLSFCRALCDASLGQGCDAEFTALNDCQLTGDFSCGFISAESDADCEGEVTAYTQCSACDGANDDGFCPSVACDCPDGTQQISASIGNGSGCTCADAASCKDFCF